MTIAEQLSGGSSTRFSFDSSTGIRVGPGIRSQVPAVFAGQGCQRVALITDKGLIAAGVVEKILAAFEGQDVEIAGIFDNVQRDNHMKDIDDCARWYQELGADGILAVGGGSVLDAGKCVKVLLGMKADSIKDVMKDKHVIYYAQPDAQPLGIPHVSMPTTAGTGADVSPASALLDEESRAKLILFHEFMNSDLAYLDAELTVTLPPNLTAEPGFDSLSHSIESFFSNNANSIADAFALRSARLVYKNLGTAVENGNDIKARTEMQTASAMSVLANVSALGAPVIHSFADSIGPMYGISHGLANAVYVPIVMKNMPSHFLPRIKEFAQCLDIPFDADGDDQQILEGTVAEFVALQEKCGIAPRFDMEVDRSEFDNLVKAVQEDPTSKLFPLPDDVIIACLEESIHFK